MTELFPAMTDGYTLRELADLLNGDLADCSQPAFRITGVSTLQDAGRSDVCYYGNSRYSAFLKTTSAGAVIVDRQVETTAAVQIVVKNAYEGFRKALELFVPDRASGFKGVHPSSVIHPTSVLGENSIVGPCAVIDRDCFIGNKVSIGAGAVLGPGVSIGDNTVIYPNVSLLARTRVGAFSVIHSGTTVGSDGFGFVPSASGEHKKVPQNGNVIIGDHVEIGSGCSIDRAVTGSTVIGDHTKLDNLIQVAHNVQIGRGCMIAAQTGIAGSTVIGDGVVFGGQVGVAGHIVINDGVVVAAKSGVTKSIPAGLTVSGNPCRPHGENLRISAAAARLPGIIKEIEALAAGCSKETED